MRTGSAIAFVVAALVIGVTVGGYARLSLLGTPPLASTTVYVTRTALASVTSTVTARAALGTVQGLCFSPDRGCASLLTRWIDQTNATIHVMIYVFTSDTIADALIRAAQRGVQVLVVVEEGEATILGSEVERLRAAGVEVRLDGNSALMHHKVAILDGTVVVTGSYNWSAAAEERNNENLLILTDPTVAAQYEQAFSAIWEAAAP